MSRKINVAVRSVLYNESFGLAVFESNRLINLTKIQVVI